METSLKLYAYEGNDPEDPTMYQQLVLSNDDKARHRIRSQSCELLHAEAKEASLGSSTVNSHVCQGYPQFWPFIQERRGM